MSVFLPRCSHRLVLCTCTYIVRWLGQVPGVCDKAYATYQLISVSRNASFHVLPALCVVVGR